MERVQVAFEQNDRRQPVHRGGAFLNTDATFLKDALGRDGGEALVPKLDGNAARRAQPLRKIAAVFRLAAFGAAHVQWFAHQYEGDVFPGDELHQMSKILAYVGTLERFESLGRDTQLIADGEPDATFSKIQCEYPSRHVLSHLSSMMKARTRLPNPIQCVDRPTPASASLRPRRRLRFFISAACSS